MEHREKTRLRQFMSDHNKDTRPIRLSACCACISFTRLVVPPGVLSQRPRSVAASVFPTWSTSRIFASLVQHRHFTSLLSEEARLLNACALCCSTSMRPAYIRRRSMTTLLKLLSMPNLASNFGPLSGARHGRGDTSTGRLMPLAHPPYLVSGANVVAASNSSPPMDASPYTAPRVRGTGVGFSAPIAFRVASRITSEERLLSALVGSAHSSQA